MGQASTQTPGWRGEGAAMGERLNVKALLRRHGLRPKRSWSQNFLVDVDVLTAIAAACEAGPEDAVVELGAGLGALTALLARRAGRVVAVERDRDMACVLRSEFAGDGRVEVVEANAATLDWPGLVARLGHPPRVVGNLPYHMASQILFHLLEAGAGLRSWVLMVQREMAERVASRPGSKAWGVLGALVQQRADVQRVLEVPPSAFHPKPEVHSTVLRFSPLQGLRVPVRDERLFERLVKGLFQQRRKTLRNGLKAAFGAQLDPPALDRVLDRAGLEAGVRAEQLGLVQLGALADALAEAIA